MTQTDISAAPSRDEPVRLRKPDIADGVALWQLAKNTAVLDVNSSYSYLLWCRDFRDTSILAEVEGRAVGFVTGYLRPGSSQTLFVWQVAVDESQRGKGIALGMLDRLLDEVVPHGVTTLETTVSPDNAASLAMFGALAERRGATLSTQDLFVPSHFSDAHEPEDLYTLHPVHEPDRRRRPKGRPTP